MSPVEWTELPPRALAAQGRAAGLVSRTLAAWIDGLAVAVGVLAAYLGVFGARFVISPSSWKNPPQLSWWLVPLVVTIALTYLTVCWRSAGRTFGDSLFGLRVVTVSGRRLDWGRAALRSALCLIVPIGLLWVAPSRTNMSLQDHVVRTRVVYDWAPRVVDG